MSDQEKIDWKYPHLARFKNYAIGFGAAAAFIALVLTAVYFWLKPEPLFPQTEPTMTVYPLPQNQAKDQFVKPNKKVTQSVKKSEAKPTVNEMETVEKPIKPAEPLTQFDRDLAEFERKIP